MVTKDLSFNKIYFAKGPFVKPSYLAYHLNFTSESNDHA